MLRPALLLFGLLAFQGLPPLGFLGFRPGMPLKQAEQLIRDREGTLQCRGSSDRRIRECTGMLPYPGVDRPLSVLISSIRDSAAVIVLSGILPSDTARTWIEDLAIDFGRPNHVSEAGVQDSWQWIRRSRMLRVTVRWPGPSFEAAVTLTDGPLLDGLGSPEKQKPD